MSNPNASQRSTTTLVVAGVVLLVAGIAMAIVGFSDSGAFLGVMGSIIAVCGVIWGMDGVWSSAYGIALVLVNFAIAAALIAALASTAGPSNAAATLSISLPTAASESPRPVDP